MKYMRVAGLCLVAVCALFAVTSSAFATEGSLEFGKCNKTAIAEGTCSNAGCTKIAKTDEINKFNWESLLGKTVQFTSAKGAEPATRCLKPRTTTRSRAKPRPDGRRIRTRLASAARETEWRP